ncbi:unnamed protein product [Cunninghamella echinulata]
MTTSNTSIQTRRTSSRLAGRNRAIPKLNPLKKAHIKREINKKIIDNKLQKRKRVLKEREIDSINDFRYLKDGTIQYQVCYSDGLYVWQNESMMGGHSKVKDFQEQVKSKIGFIIPEQKFHTLSSTRSSRLAKSRAQFHLKNVFEDDEDEEEDNQLMDDNNNSEDDDEINLPTSKRKRSGRSTPISKEKKPRKSGKKVQQAQKRKERQQQRQSILLQDNDGDNDTSLDDATFCCLNCSIKLYRQAIEKNPNDSTVLEEIINNRTNIPHWKDENVYISTDNILQLALLKGSIQQAILLNNDDESGRVEISDKFKSYSDGSTGSNINGHGFRNAMRKVNESRGNRQGNSAFYRESIPDPMNVEFIKVRDSKFTEMTVLSCLTHTNLTCLPNVIENLYLTKCNNLAGVDLVYFAVASGNNILASKLMEEYKQMPWFNHLHIDTLKLINGEQLESYRRNQILKQAKESKRITPLCCAAINPKSTYLRVLYEQLEDLERFISDDYGRSIAHFAAASSTPDCLEFLIEEKYNGLDNADVFKITPLIQAARYGRYANIRPLLNYLSENKLPSTSHADHTLLRNKSRPLHYAAAYGHARTCQALIDCGSTIDIYNTIDRSTPLMLASNYGHLETVKCLVENGADPEAIDKYGRTPLHLACIQGHYDIVHYLLTIGVDADCPDTSLNRPVHYAAAFGWLSIIQLLVDLGQVDLAAFNVWRTTPLSIAMIKGHFSIVNFILTSDEFKMDVNFKDSNEETMLHHCISSKIISASDGDKNLKYLTLLLEKGADPNAFTKEGLNAFHLLNKVCKFNRFGDNGQTAFLKDYQIKAANLLYQYGVDIHANNPFLTMIEQGCHHMVEWFIKHGITYWNKATSQYNYNFFHYCFRAAVEIDEYSVRNDDASKLIKQTMEYEFYKVWEAVKCHLPAPDDMDKTTLYEPESRNITPVIYGVKHSFKPKINDKDKTEENFKHLFTLINNLKDYFNLDLKNAFANSGLLHTVASYYNVAMFLYLLKNGCDPNEKIVKDKTTQIFLGTVLNQGENPVFRDPVSHKLTPHLVYVFLQEVLPQWIDHGGDLNMKTDDNVTSIMYAVRYRHPGILKLILDSTLGPSWNTNTDLSSLTDSLINAVSDSNKTALSQAVLNILAINVNSRDYTCIEYILDAGGDINFKYSEKGTSILMKVIQSEDIKLLKLIFEKTKFPLNHTLLNSDYTSGLSIASATKNFNHFTVYFERLLQDCSPDTITGLINTKQKSGRTCLIRAIQSRNISTVNQLLSHGADPNFTEPGCENPLFTAFAHSIDEVVIKLLEAGANPNIHKESTGDTPLHLAIATGNMDMIKLLLKYNADVNAVNNKLRTPMHQAISISLLKSTRSFRVERLLLKTGLININALDILGRTPLHLAFIPNDTIPATHMTTSSTGRFKLYEQQKEKAKKSEKIDIDDTKNELYDKERAKEKEEEIEEEKEEEKESKFAPFGTEYESWLTESYSNINSNQNSVMQNNEKVQDSFWQNYKKRQEEYDMEEKLEKTPEVSIELSFSEKEKQLFKAYEAYGDCWEDESYIADHMDPIDMVIFLSSIDGIQYDIKDVFGRSPIHYAAILGAFTCTTFFLNNHIDINSTDGDNNTPFHLALLYKRSDYSVMLCNCGATLTDIANLHGQKQSVFTYCLNSSYMNLVYLILGKGANVLDGIQMALKKENYYLADSLLKSATPQSLLSETSRKQTLWHLISDFKPMDNDTWQEYLVYFIERLTEINLDITFDDDQRSPVHYAVINGQATLLKHLLALPNCPLNTFDVSDYSELSCALYSQNIEIIELLLENGALIDKAVNLEKNPSLLSEAVSMSMYNIDIIKLLLSKGCPVDQDSKYNRPSPLMSAIVLNRSNIVQILVDHGADVNQVSRYSDVLFGQRSTITGFGRQSQTPTFGNVTALISGKPMGIGSYQGTGATKFAPTLYRDPYLHTNFFFQTITAMTQYSQYSVEELRLQDYYQNRVTGVTTSFGVTDTAITGLDQSNTSDPFVRAQPTVATISGFGAQPITHEGLVDQTKNTGTSTCSLTIHPLYLASLYSEDSLKILINSGADINATCPSNYVLYQSGYLPIKNLCSLFLYHFYKQNIPILKLLIEKRIDLSLLDNNSDKTIFEHIIFKYCDEYSHNEQWSTLMDMIFENYSAEKLSLNIIDKETGASPLEILIRQPFTNLKLIKQLIGFGADPNLRSCSSNITGLFEIYNEPLNAVFHCVFNRKYDLLKEIASLCPYINWKDQDKLGRTVIAYLVTANFPYFRDTSSIIKDIANTIGSNYLDVINIADHEGYTPAEYAYTSGRKELIQTFLDLGVPNVTKWPSIDHSIPSAVDYIPLSTVELDAEAERELLQARKDALKPADDKKTKNVIPIDPDSNLQSIGFVVYDNGEAYDIMIMKIDVTQSAHGCNMFYKMSVIFNKVLEVYVLFTKWGTFGDRGSEWHQKTPYQDKESAINEFKSIFKAKTGNHWEDRSTNFVPQPGKFELIKAKQTKDDIVSESDFQVDETVPSQFSNGLVQTMHTFCSIADLKRGYKQLQMDLPIGQIPQSSIDEAISILKELEPLIRQYEDMGSNMTSTEDRTNQRVLVHEIAQKTNAYYRLLPRPSDFSKGGITPILQHYVLNKEKARLLEIGYVNFSANVLLAAKYRASEINSMDYAYRSLGCQLTDILEGTAEYNMINKYMTSTSGHYTGTYQISNIFSIHRQDEVERYKPFENNFNRKLLWHGSRTENFMGILKQGLLLKPSRANISGSMFGEGLYFADMFCKSVNYCRSSSHPAFATLLLCEVALGEECEMYNYQQDAYQPDEKGHLSVKGLGKNAPCKENAIYDENGVYIPMGPPSPVQNHYSYSLNYNEYIVYDTAQVKMRYLVTLRDINYCHICEHNGNCLPFDQHIWNNVNFFKDRNEFDATIERCYLYRTKQTLQKLYNDNLDDHIKKMDYINKLKIAPPSRKSIVCNGCSKNSLNMILQDDMEKNSSELPDVYMKRELCKDRNNCKLQDYDEDVEGSGIPHCKLFRHVDFL